MIRPALKTMGEKNLFHVAFFFLSLFVIFSRFSLSSESLHVTNEEISFMEVIAGSSSHAHPPGYILYLLLGRVLNKWINSPYQTLVAMRTIFTLFSVWAVYHFGSMVNGRKAAFFSAAIMSFNPVVWYYGIRTNTYPASLFFSTVCAMLIYLSIKQKRELFLYWFCIFWAVGAGFRQDLALFLFPLWVLGIIGIGKRKPIFISAIITIIFFVMWLIPLIESFGGLQAYAGSLNKQCNVLLWHSSAATLGWKAIVRNSIKWAGPLFWGLGGSSALVIYFLSRYQTVYPKDSELLKTLMVWFFPSFCFFIFAFMGVGGYLFCHLGVFYITIGGALQHLSDRMGKRAVWLLVLTFCLCGAFQFLFTAPLEEKNLFFSGLNKIFYRFTKAGLDMDLDSKSLHLFYS